MPLTFFKLYTVYVKKLGQFFFCIYLLVNLYIPVLLMFEQFDQYKNNGLTKIPCICTQSL